MSVIAALSDAACREFLVAALWGQVNYVREHGDEPPAPVMAFLDELVRTDRSRQEPTTSAEGLGGAPDGVDHRHVRQELFTIGQTAHLLNVDERTVERLIERGALASVTLGRLRRVRRTVAYEYLDRLSEPTEGAA